MTRSRFVGRSVDLPIGRFFREYYSPCWRPAFRARLAKAVDGASIGRAALLPPKPLRPLKRDAVRLDRIENPSGFQIPRQRLGLRSRSGSGVTALRKPTPVGNDSIAIGHVQKRRLHCVAPPHSKPWRKLRVHGVFNHVQSVEWRPFCLTSPTALSRHTFDKPPTPTDGGNPSQPILPLA